MAENNNVFYGNTRRIKTGCGNLYVTFNFSEPEQKYLQHIHIRLGKTGGCARAHTEALQEVFNWGLAAGGDILGIIEKLRGISCHLPLPGAQSCSDAIARAIEDMINSEGIKRYEERTNI